jgi:hypothetical protein
MVALAERGADDSRLRRRRPPEVDATVTPVASGFITGESLMGVPCSAGAEAPDATARPTSVTPGVTSDDPNH